MLSTSKILNLLIKFSFVTKFYNLLQTLSYSTLSRLAQNGIHSLPISPLHYSLFYYFNTQFLLKKINEATKYNHTKTKLNSHENITFQDITLCIPFWQTKF